MQTPQETTKMVDKPKNPTKMVKIRAERTIKPNSLEGKMLAAGEEAEVSEEDAKEFCDKTISGFADHEGEISSKNAKAQEIKRAVRL